MATVLTNDKGSVRTLTLNRPEVLNAFNGPLMDDLTDEVRSAAEAPSVKVLVLTGAGRAFSAGADLSEMGNTGYRPRHGFAGLMDALVDFPKPLLLAINGVGAGIGATLCGIADGVYMAASARLRCPFSALGLTAEAGSTLLFPKLMGRQRAAWFLLAAEWMSAQECVDAGLALEVLPDDALAERVKARAETLAALPLASLIQTKALIMDPLREPLRASIRAENAGLASLMGGPANKEALAAFQSRRPPDFTGL